MAEWQQLGSAVNPLLRDYYRTHPAKFRFPHNDGEAEIEGFAEYASSHGIHLKEGKIVDPWGDPVHFVIDHNGERALAQRGDNLMLLLIRFPIKSLLVCCLITLAALTRALASNGLCKMDTFPRGLVTNSRIYQDTISCLGVGIYVKGLSPCLIASELRCRTIHVLNSLTKFTTHTFSSRTNFRLEIHRNFIEKSRV